MRGGLTFLLEIGVEEIPDWMIEPALENLASSFRALLEQNRLAAEQIATDATPRRLVLRAASVTPRQNDSEELVTGPPKSAGQGAAAGFARKLGVTPDQLTSVETPKGEYLACRRAVAGRETSAILAAALPEIILGIPWPKTMYWTHRAGPRFIRPIRWLVALLGDGVIAFEIAGVKAGSATRGHRRLGEAGPLPVRYDDYEAVLEKNFVLVSAKSRREKILREAAAVLPAGLRMKDDAALLDSLVYITEFPTPIRGSFDESYLQLPAEVLITVMRHHQKYFSVEHADGTLAPHFIAVMNTSADPDGLVRQGNERVLRARFNDARFFWDVDQHKKLDARLDDLAHVTFQAQLGSYLEKAERMAKLVQEFGGGEPAVRAALLSKCDLTCEMVKEFTDLQGVVGGLYARAQGESERVALAIYDHYSPLSMEDSIPRTLDGRLVALADKVDTLRGCFRIGMIPSGSRDPFALRRAAQGVVKILVEGGIALGLAQLSAGDARLEEFLLDRVKYYFREIRGFAYDEVNAALAAGSDDLADAEARLSALKAVRPTENFEPLAASFKRIRNILKQAQFEGGVALSRTLLEAGPETALHEAFQSVTARVEPMRSRREYQPALEAIASLRPAVDLFFDKVLVNAPDAAIRRNRLSLLHGILTGFSSIADFSEIVSSHESSQNS
ncbi:MAG: glycine--tRNA ligase subunit beta [Bryobacterales bacterium]|nr:glycine--tRNA ligase subunit beta [Bryobacterales bacterium]